MRMKMLVDGDQVVGVLLDPLAGLFAHSRSCREQGDEDEGIVD
jgi:hypothetical protein